MYKSMFYIDYTITFAVLDLPLPINYPWARFHLANCWFAGHQARARNIDYNWEPRPVSHKYGRSTHPET